MLIILFYFRIYQAPSDGKKKDPSPTDHLRNNEIHNIKTKKFYSWKDTKDEKQAT